MASAGPNQGGRRSGRGGPVRALWAVACAAAAVLALLVGTQTDAVAASAPVDVSFIGHDGGLYGFGRTPDGTWSSAVPYAAPGFAPNDAPTAALRLASGTVVATVTSHGNFLMGCPTRGQALTQVPGTGTMVPGSHIALAQSGDTVMAEVINPSTARPGSVFAEVINPCGPSTITARANAPAAVPMSPTLPLPPPGANAAATVAGGEFGFFFVDDGGRVLAQWRTTDGVWSSSALTAAGASTPGSDVAVTPDGQWLAYTDHGGIVYLVRPLVGGGLAGAPLALPWTAATHAPDGASLTVSSNSAGVFVGYVASGGTLSVAQVDASGHALAPVALTDPGFAAAGSSVGSSVAADEGDFVCGTTTGRPVRIKFTPGGGPGTVFPMGPPNLVSSATVFAVD